MKTPLFYNSLTKQVEPLTPQEPGKVRIYNCGPTVYKRQHLGNMRRFLFSDFLRRTLEILGYEVREITNITDVGHLTEDDIDSGEDKLEAQAKREQKTPAEIAEQQIRLFKQDLTTLHVQSAHMYPRASAHIPHMQNLIAALIENGHAYQTPTGVYFDVTTFSDYGKLSGNTLANLEAGARIEINPDKKHPADFALWKTNDPKHLQQWDSPWGRGYPGWHIECSAMSMEYLGSDIDIHTGGEDNRFPHHENEIAQSEGATGKRFVRHWMHNAHLLLNDAKLAKREGEQLTLDTLTEKDFSPLVFRMLVLGSHYRSPANFTWEAMHQAQENLSSIANLVRRLHEEELAPGTPDSTAIVKFTEALADDLNTPEALATVLEYVRAANSILDGKHTVEETNAIYATLKEFDRLLGVIDSIEKDLDDMEIPKSVEQLVQQREDARLTKDFALADELRDKILAEGYTVEDSPTGPRITKT